MRLWSSVSHPKEEHKFRVFESGLLRSVLVPKREVTWFCWKLYNYLPHDLLFPLEAYKRRQPGRQDTTGRKMEIKGGVTITETRTCCSPNLWSDDDDGDDDDYYLYTSQNVTLSSFRFYRLGHPTHFSSELTSKTTDIYRQLIGLPGWGIGPS